MVSPNIKVVGLISLIGLGLIKPLYAEASKKEHSPKGESSSRSNDSAELQLKQGFGDKKFELFPPGDLRLRSDRQSYDSRKQRFIAEGRAIAFLGDSVLKADRIEVDEQTQVIRAIGRVRLKKGTQYFQATFLRYNLISKEGILKNVYGVIDQRRSLNPLSSSSIKISPTASEFELEERRILFMENKDREMPEYFPINKFNGNLRDKFVQNSKNIEFKKGISIKAGFGAS